MPSSAPASRQNAPDAAATTAGEFALIQRHFSRPCGHTALAGGDDAALLHPRPGMELAVSADMLVAGTHFFPDADPHDLGWKTLAVNVSDLAAMGADPRWALLSLALPAADDAWIAAFADGFYACAERFGVDLAGGDTTRGPLTLSVTILGEVPRGQALTRAGANAGDDIWVSGQPGLAALGLEMLRGTFAPTADGERCLAALHRPQPRVALGQALRGLASAALDISDGLLGDLGHILVQSRCGATLHEDALPLAALYATGASPALARRCLLAGGDDYELLFCAPPAARAAITALGPALALPLTRIGTLSDAPGTVALRSADGTLTALAARGYDHFG
ncbi:thiamine-phosphate kinase [Azoarcus olearius]|uniref:Thiamine-monophosphate kinase n=1 Tax=Azoarcus sp. (strain BH72) TaxID=418699 RepID=A1K2S2_AZOSB|nr:thiamine-phosphate kinase [Azoarcus olearius]CAL93127.1 thiamine-phosphate kinase [Azoarcus olearius]